jgi:acyl transferase domain-containing protein
MTAAADPRPEPIAIVGIGALYPRARGVEAYWRLLGAADPDPGPGLPQAGAADGAPVSELDDVEVDPARFGIPPAQARSMARMQLLMLETARQCLDDAGWQRRAQQAERTDVIVGTCFGLDRQYANALRVEAARYGRDLGRVLAARDFGPRQADPAAQLDEALRSLLGGSPHDRVGEMASSIPARIAAAFKLRGQTLAVESADATSFLAVFHALTNLRAGVSDAALVVCGQRTEDRLPALALSAKGLEPGPARPFAADGHGFDLAEGVGALLLKRLSAATADGDRIYALIRDCALGFDPRPGVLRYSTSVERHREVAAAAHRTTSTSSATVQYVECAGSGIASQTRAELHALAEIFASSPRGSIAVGSVKDRLGHTFANAGLAAMTKSALALYHRRIPAHWPREDTALLDLADTPFRLPTMSQDWPAAAPGTPRRAAVSGCALTGVLCHLILEEHNAAVPIRAGHRPPGRPATGAVEPIAVLGYGAHFADSPGAGRFWQALCSGRDRIGPLPAATLDRSLYHRPQALSPAHSYTDRGAHTDVPEAPPPELRITPARYSAMDAAQRLTLAVAGAMFARLGPDRRAVQGRGLIAIGSTLSLTRERRAAAELALPLIEAAVTGLPALGHLAPDEMAALLKLVRERYGTPPDRLSPLLLDGFLASGVAAVIAHEYRLAAVPVAVEAACASSLAAIDLAIGALRSGAVDFAVAGGVELPCNARDLVLCSALGLLSHSTITPFDAAADGFTPGDGCGLFLLKRQSDSLRDGDEILGLLRAVGASNDAKSLIAPDADGQARAMRRAFDQIDFDPVDVGYLEAHGTGTAVGDRVEIEATAQVYADPRRRSPLGIGSAKSVFGHTFAAAGSAGLLSALHAVRSGTQPPVANLRTINPALDLAAIPARIPTCRTPWTAEPGRPRRAGVSSFGTGGINYHLLVEESLEEHR